MENTINLTSLVVEAMSLPSDMIIAGQPSRSTARHFFRLFTKIVFKLDQTFNEEREDDHILDGVQDVHEDIGYHDSGAAEVRSRMIRSEFQREFRDTHLPPIRDAFLARLLAN